MKILRLLVQSILFVHVLNTKPKENSLVYVYFLFWITFKFILLPSAVSFRYYPINDYAAALLRRRRRSDDGGGKTLHL